MVGADRSVAVTLSIGETLRGSLRATWSVSQARSLVVRTLDLKSAYRQLLVRRDKRWCNIVQVFNTDKNSHEVCVSRALPFGATAAVYHFNRLAKVLRAVGTKLFWPSWTNFFDDYTQPGPGLMAEANQKRLRVSWTL